MHDLKNPILQKSLEETPNPEEIVIRRIKAGDFDQVLRLVSSAFQREVEIAGLDIRRLKSATRLYRIMSGFLFLFDVFHVDVETILVALSGNTVVGAVHLVPRRKRIWSIDSVAVDPRFRRRGIYRNLMREAIKYVAHRKGERIVQSIHTNNVPPVKVANELKFEVLEELSLLYAETNPITLKAVRNDISVRAIRSTDVEQVFEICRKLDPKRIEAYKVSATDFLEGFASRVRKRIFGIHSERWVLDFDGEIVGYTSVAYTSPEEAGNIESFYLKSGMDYSELTRELLAHVFNFLSARNIKRVTTGLNKEWREIIEAFQSFGFRQSAFSYDTVKDLTRCCDVLTQGSGK